MNEPETRQSIDPELERRLDRLAGFDRAVLSDESLARIATAASCASVPAARSVRPPSTQPAMIRVSSWLGSPARLAAGLALIASVGALWMARRSSPTVSSEAEQLDAWMAAVWPNDESDPFAEAIESLEADAEEFGASRDEPLALDLSEEDAL